MTLILATGNPDHAVIVADRRVLADGLPTEDGSNDAALVLTKDARLGATFIGLARSGLFETRKWLLLALHASMQPEGRLSFEKLCLLADLQWTKHADPDKRLTVVLAGHVTDAGLRYPALGIVSNWELPPDMDEEQPIDGRFRSVWWRHTTPRNFGESYAVPSGVIEAVTQEEIDELKQLAVSGASPEAIVERSVAIVQGAADRPEAEGALGGDCVSIVLSADPGVEPVVAAHVRGRRIALALPSVVTPEGIVTEDLVARTGERGLEREKVGRNSACPCGSGRKYKYCHGT